LDRRSQPPQIHAQLMQGFWLVLLPQPGAVLINVPEAGLQLLEALLPPAWDHGHRDHLLFSS
jgi:hypothetical protein